MIKRLICNFITMCLSAILCIVAQSINSYAYTDEYNGFTMDEINKSEIKPRIYLTVDGKEKGKLYTTADGGKKVTVAINVEGAQYKYAHTGFHIYYDGRLRITQNQKTGMVNVEPSNAFSDLSINAPEEDPTAPAGFKGVFLATAGFENTGLDGEMWKIEFQLPSYLQAGQIFPIDIMYKSNKNAEDLFTGTEFSETDRLMQAYAFTKGIYNTTENRTFYPDYNDIKNCNSLSNINKSMDGYIAIAVPQITTTTATTTTTTTTTTSATTVTTPVIPDLGDINGDEKVDAKDASEILVYYSKMSTGSGATITEKQLKAGNINGDALIDAKDASLILSYYSYISTHEAVSVYDFVNGNIPTSPLVDSATQIGDTIFDSNNIIVKYRGITEKSEMKYFNIYIENNTEKDLCFQVRNTSINGYMVDGNMSTDIAAGKKANTAIIVKNIELGNNGISIIDDIEFRLHAFDWNDMDFRMDSKPIVIKVE